MRGPNASSPASPPAPPPDRHRLDVWLWHARCVRTRTAAAELVKGGRVRLNGARVTAPGHAVKRGDVVTLALSGGVRLLRVAGFSERRGDARAASDTYIEVEAESRVREP